MDKPIIRSEHVVPLLETKFIKVYDLQYAPGKHYYDATRRDKENLVAVKTIDEARTMTADAVSCVVVLNVKDEEPKLLLSYEFRYPCGQFLLSVPAGLIDKEDLDAPDPLLVTAKRELAEETGIVFADTDEARVINPLLFSTPGMTDESNALVLLVLHRDEIPAMSSDGTVGSECFDGFQLFTKADAQKVLAGGVDPNGIPYSVYTFMALNYFVNDSWK